MQGQSGRTYSRQPPIGETGFDGYGYCGSRLSGCEGLIDLRRRPGRCGQQPDEPADWSDCLPSRKNADDRIFCRHVCISELGSLLPRVRRETVYVLGAEGLFRRCAAVRCGPVVGGALRRWVAQCDRATLHMSNREPICWAPGSSWNTPIGHSSWRLLCTTRVTARNKTRNGIPVKRRQRPAARPAASDARSRRCPPPPPDPTAASVVGMASVAAHVSEVNRNQFVDRTVAPSKVESAPCGDSRSSQRIVLWTGSAGSL